jgi:AcrR family transcriptional regulator
MKTAARTVPGTVAGARRRPRRGPGRPPGPSRTAATRTALVEAAGRQYAAGGRGGISFASLAAEAGLRKATVFHYFPTKEALVAAVFAALGARLAARAPEWFDSPPQAPAERLERVVGGLVDFYADDPVNARLICHGLLGVESWAAVPAEPTAAADGSQYFADFVRRFRDFVADGMAAGAFHPGDPLATLMSIGGVVLFECMIPPAVRGRYGWDGSRAALAAHRHAVLAFVRRAVVR